MTATNKEAIAEVVAYRHPKYPKEVSHVSWNDDCEPLVRQSSLLAEQEKVRDLEQDLQVARGQYQGACDVIKQLEAKLEAKGAEPVGRLKYAGPDQMFHTTSEAKYLPPNVWHDLFATPQPTPTVQAAVSAALRKAAEVCTKNAASTHSDMRGENQYFAAQHIAHQIDARHINAIPHDETALRELLFHVAKESADLTFENAVDGELTPDEALETIVNRVMKGEGGGGMSKSLPARYNVQAGGLCKKCGGKMVTGQALEPIMSGIPDFPGDKHPVTVSPSGKARLVSCIKCEQCGWSVN